MTTNEAIKLLESKRGANLAGAVTLSDNEVQGIIDCISALPVLPKDEPPSKVDLALSHLVCEIEIHLKQAEVNAAKERLKRETSAWEESHQNSLARVIKGGLGK